MSQRLSPTLDELLGDSLIQAVMRADHVEPQAVRALFAEPAGRIVRRAQRRTESRERIFPETVDRPAPLASDVRRAARKTGAAARPLRVGDLLLS